MAGDNYLGLGSGLGEYLQVPSQSVTPEGSKFLPRILSRSEVLDLSHSSPRKMNSDGMLTVLALGKDSMFMAFTYQASRSL